MSDFKIICGFCQQSNSMDSWIYRQPKEHYCCPNCKRTVRRVLGKCTVTQNGFILPGKITITEVTTQCGVTRPS
jgi:hypothetical protein